MSERLNELVRNLPVARFYYKGQSHSHPVRRTVLIFETGSNTFTGYELREGNTTRTVGAAPIKTFRKDRIATRAQCRTDSVMRQVGKKRLTETTLSRTSLETVTGN
jgi:hypothetical protein